MIFEERVLPDKSGLASWLRRQHLARYRWVSQWVSGRRVIDVASGLGYGSLEMLRAGAVSVAGYDADPSSVAHCRRAAAGRPGLTFDTADATRLPLPGGAADVYVSFETIEHIPDDDAFLAEAVRVVRPGGLFVCSTPNRTLFNPGTCLTDVPLNPFHVREYDLSEFRARVGRHFSRVEWYGQTAYTFGYSSALAAVGHRGPRIAARLHQFCKLVGSVRGSYATHYPRSLTRHWLPEIMIAVCHR